MKKVIVFVFVLFISVNCFANIHCGEGEIEIFCNEIKTPNGGVFEVIKGQRGEIIPSAKYSCSYNFETGQLFLWEIHEKSWIGAFGNETNVTALPNVCLRVELLRVEK